MTGISPYRTPPVLAPRMPYKRPWWRRLIRGYRKLRVAFSGQFRERTGRCPYCHQVVLRRQPWPIRLVSPWEPLFTPFPPICCKCRGNLDYRETA